MGSSAMTHFHSGENMNKTTMILAAICTAFSTAALAGEPPVPVNTSGLEPGVAAEVRKHANEGMTSLSKYLERTRKENRLTIADVTQPPVSVEPIKDPSKEYKKHAHEYK
jgi:hypothetical protein